MRLPRHFLTIISWLITSISLSLAFYFYTEAQKLPQLSYTVKPIRGVIVRSGRSSKMVVRYGNDVLGSDITAVQIVFWNEGKRAIKRPDILKPITIQTEKNARILEVSNLSCTREVIHPDLTRSALGNGVTTVTWDILEESDGCTAQIIYEGKPDLNVYLDGIVENQKRINFIPSPEGKIYRKEFNRSARKDFEAYSIFILISSILMVCALVSPIAGQSMPIWIRMPLALIMVCCIGVIFHHLLYGYVEPPFGF
jgi:hypothetical protein